MIKLIKNPYLVAIAILVSEIAINMTVSKVAGIELGDNNISAGLIFLGAGLLVASYTKVRMSRSYNLKVIGTYFLIVFAIVTLSALGSEGLSPQGLIIGTLFLALFAGISYAAFAWGQKLSVDALGKKQAAETKSQPDQSDAGGSNNAS